MSTRTLPLSMALSRPPLSSGPESFAGVLASAELACHCGRPGSGKTMGICDLRDEACRQAGMIGGQRYPVLP